MVDFIVLCNVFPHGIRRCKITAAEVNQKFHQVGGGKRKTTQFPAAFDFGYLVTEFFQTDQGIMIRTDQTVIFACRVVKAFGNIISAFPHTFKIIIGNPDNKTFIWFTRLNFGAVNVHVVGQENVTGAQMVGFTLNAVTDVAGEKEKNFIERVLVKVHFRRNFITVVEKFKIFFPHNLTFGENILVHAA